MMSCGQDNSSTEHSRLNIGVGSKWPCCNPREREHWLSFLARVSLAHKVDARKVLFPDSPLVSFRSPARAHASNSTAIGAPASALASPGASDDDMLSGAIRASLEDISLITVNEDQLNNLPDEPAKLVRVNFQV